MRLIEVAQIGSGMSVSKNRKINTPISVSYLRVANVQRGKLDLREIKTMLIEETNIKYFELKYADILFNEGGG